MRKEAYLIGGTAAVLVAATVLGATYFRRAQQRERQEVAAKTPAPAPAVYVRPHSHTLGPPDAKVTLVEFLDPECESCRAMYPMVKHLLGEYSGRVRLVIRYMPFHPNSLFAAAALEAAAEQGRYWDMLETLFANQPQWGSHHDPKPHLIPELARGIGLDMAAFGEAMTNPAARQKVEIDRADGQSLGVTGTPTFFVNGKRLERLGYEPLKALIDEALAK